MREQDRGAEEREREREKERLTNPNVNIDTVKTWGGNWAGQKKGMLFAR